jgi:hypothetical protein
LEYVIEEDLKYFINKLPDLNRPEYVHLIMLAIRSRKAREMMGVKVKDLVVEREIIRKIDDWKLRYFNSVYNMSVLQHMGKYEVKGNYAPAQCMGIFATLSPRNVITALEQLTNENMKHLFSLSKPDGTVINYHLEMMELAKQTSKYFGALHAHRDRKYHFVTLDIDQDSNQTLVGMLDMVSPLNIWMVTETSRGFHIILDLSKSSDAEAYYGKKPQDGIHFKLAEKYKDKYDFQRDSQEPVAGTLYYKEKDTLHYVRIIR